MFKNVANSLKNLKIIRLKRFFSSTANSEIKQDANKNVLTDVRGYFREIDLRVGKIIHIEEMKDSENIFCCKIDIGEKIIREIGTGIRKYVKKEEMENSNVIVFSNLKPRKLGGFISNGMILCAGNQSSIEVLRPPSESKFGDKIQIEGDLKIDPELVIDTLHDKKLKKYVQYFHTDNNFFCTFNGYKLMINENYLKVLKLNNSKIS